MIGTRPMLALDIPCLRANALAWRAFAGVPLRAVVKSDGYGWGFETLVRALEDVVDAFIVADVEEFDRVRLLTRRPVVTLGDTPAERVPGILEAGGIPNLASLSGIRAAAAWARAGERVARVRIGLSPAVGWFGFSRDELRAHAADLANAALELELWTHVTDAREAERQRAELAEALGILRAAGARVLSTDVESTEPLAAGTVRGGAFARLGIGLFGARYGGGPKELRCALRMEARVMRCFAAKGQFVGYGLARAPESGYLVILRCGYGDGLFRMTGTERGIIAMGMQYTTLWRRNPIDVQSVPILDADTDLDDFARAAGVTPHEIVLRLGAAARSRGYEG